MLLCFVMTYFFIVVFQPLFLRVDTLYLFKY